MRGRPRKVAPPVGFSSSHHVRDDAKVPNVRERHAPPEHVEVILQSHRAEARVDAIPFVVVGMPPTSKSADAPSFDDDVATTTRTSSSTSLSPSPSPSHARSRTSTTKRDDGTATTMRRSAVAVGGSIASSSSFRSRRGGTAGGAAAAASP